MYSSSKKLSQKPASAKPNGALGSFERMSRDVTQRKLQEVANDFTHSKWTGDSQETNERIFQKNKINQVESLVPVSLESAAGIVVQRMIAAKESNGIATATGDGKRPAGSQSGGGQGDHTTAYVTFEHQMINSIYGMNLPTAWNSLLATHLTIGKLPGYSESPKWLTGQSDNLYLKNSKLDPKSVSIENIETYANFLLEVRNRLALTSLPTSGGSTGGQNESTHAGGLQAEERNIRNDKDPKYSKDVVMISMLKLLDHTRLNTSVKDSTKMDKILSQHITSILDTYWRVAKAYKISASDLLNFYQKYSW